MVGPDLAFAAELFFGGLPRGQKVRNMNPLFKAFGCDYSELLGEHCTHLTLAIFKPDESPKRSDSAMEQNSLHLTCYTYIVKYEGQCWVCPLNCCCTFLFGDHWDRHDAWVCHPRSLSSQKDCRKLRSIF